MRKIVLVALLGWISFVSQPCDASPTTDAWRSLANSDSKAALRLIETEHPGTAPELGDATFQKRLAIAKAHTAERLPKIVDYASYSALMIGISADFQDLHIWSDPIVSSRYANTTGITLVWQADHWLVGAQKPIKGEPSLLGAVFQGCDGQDAYTWAFPRITAFRSNPNIEAVRAAASTWLLLDEGNPFLVRPTRCRFSKPGSPAIDVPLHWRPALVNDIRAVAKEANKFGDAGIKVDRFKGGWWIGLDTLQDGVQKVVDLVRGNLTEIRAAPTIVIDLRGNGGGNSAYSDAIARLIVGEKRFIASQITPAPCSGDYWRVSPGALITLESDLKSAEDANDLVEISYDQKTIADMKQALITRRDFSPALPKCAERAAAVNQDTVPSFLPTSESKGRIIVITDRACFSSCLIATNTFHRLGATQVGEATGRSTRYMEVRRIDLPSGLRSFTTLEKVSVGVSDYGPYIPAIIYSGSFGDDDALKSWVAALPARP